MIQNCLQRNSMDCTKCGIKLQLQMNLTLLQNVDTNHIEEVLQLLLDGLHVVPLLDTSYAVTILLSIIITAAAALPCLHSTLLPSSAGELSRAARNTQTVSPSFLSLHFTTV